ncbi:MAG: ADOP family duplicated permease, partial [Terriglobales bacterium]
MVWRRGLGRWLSGAARLAGRERAIREELETHRALRAEFERRAGAEPAAARQHAERRFGNDLRLRERTLAAEGLGWVRDWRRDTRIGLRMLRRSPGFAVAAVVTLALGIGASAAVYSALDAVLLQTLPYPGVGQLVSLHERNAGSNLNLSLPDYRDWRAQNTVFSAVGAYAFGGTSNLGVDQATATFSYVTPSLFPMLGIHPWRGGDFSAGPPNPGGPIEILLGYALWKRMGADPAMVGKTMGSAPDAVRVVGILPPGFKFWLTPAQFYVSLDAMTGVPGYDDREIHPGIQGVARLRPGVTLAAARVQLATIASRLAAAYPKTNRGMGAVAEPLRSEYLGRLRGTLDLLFAGAGLMLLLACFNLANLLLARLEARKPELAVRAAIGAGAWRLRRQLLAESLVLAAMGGVAGAGLAAAVMRLVAARAPAGVPNLTGMRLDARVLGFTLIVTLASVVLFALAPTARVGQSARPVRRAPLRGFLVAEVALALALAVSAGLLLRSLAATLAADPGFNPGHLFAAKVSTQCSGAGCEAWINAALAQAGSLAGAASAAAIMQPPLEGAMWTSQYYTRPAPMLPAGDQPWAEMNFATPGYFSVVGARLVAGRDFSSADGAGSAPVAIVNQALARRLWPAGRPVGRTLHVMGAWRTVVGEVADIKQDGLDQPARPEALLPFAQMPVKFATIMVRARAGARPAALSRRLHQALAGFGAAPGAQEATDMAAVAAATAGARRFETNLLTGFAGLALLLAAVGVYGVTSFRALERQRDTSIRLALGATPRALVWAAMGETGRWVAAGLALGLGLAAALAALMRTLLYGVGPWDPASFLLALAAVALAAALAALLPARRAAHHAPAALL